MLRAPVANIFDLTLVFDKPPTALTTLAKGGTIALIRGLNPLSTILAPPLHELVHEYVVRTTVLAPVLVKVLECVWVIPITQGTATCLRVDGNLTYIALTANRWMPVVLIVAHFSNPHISQNSLCLQCIQQV
mgnify:CR=1 FL=1